MRKPVAQASSPVVARPLAWIGGLLLFCSAAQASTVISATLSITNSAALTNATSGQSYTLNSDTRTFTNSIANAATQVRVLTNYTASQILLSLVAQAGAYQFSAIQSMTTSAGTNVTFRATNDTALTITLSPTNWGRVTYTTQTVGTVTALAGLPLTAAQASQAWTNINLLSTNRTLGRVEHDGRVEFEAGLGLHGVAKTNSYTVTTNDVYVGVDTRSNTNLILTLPSATSASNLFFMVKDEGGSCATNTLKIYPASGDRIDTLLTNLVVSNNFGGVMLRSSGSTNWAIIATGGGVTGGISSGGGSGVALTNSVWVAMNGSDSTGARGDPSKAFLTLGAAKTNASSGDTIFVMPGAYSVTQSLLKNGVNWHFFNGSIVTNTGGFPGALFSDLGGTAITSTITGEGQLYDDSNAITVWLTNSASLVNIKCKALAGGNPAIDLESGTLTVEADTIAGASGTGNTIFVESGTSVLTVNRSRVVNTWNSANSRCLNYTAANTNVVLRDCVLISHTAATNSINGSASSLKIYGSLMSNKTNGPNITLLTGSTRFEVSSDVQ